MDGGDEGSERSEEWPGDEDEGGKGIEREKWGAIPITAHAHTSAGLQWQK